MKMNPSLNRSSWNEEHTLKGVEGEGDGGWSGWCKMGDGEGLVENGKKCRVNRKNKWWLKELNLKIGKKIKFVYEK